jgi:hypothetical protein
MSWTYGTATDHIDFMERLDAFLTVGHNMRPDYNAAGTGALYNIIGTTSSVQETITVTFTSSTAFTVVGSVSGSLGGGTANAVTPFTSAVVNFFVVYPGDASISDDTGPWTSGQPTGWATGDTASFVMTKPWQTVFKQMIRREIVFTNTFGYPEQAFDHNATTTSYSFSPGHIGIKFNKAIALRKFAITCSNASYAPANFSLEYSDDGAVWIAQQTYTNEAWTDNGRKIYDLGGPTALHAYWRINMFSAVVFGSPIYVANIYFIDVNTSDALMFTYDPSWWSACEILWKAPGDDGASNVFVGFRELFSISGDAYCWQTYGAANWDATINNGLPASQLRAFYGDILALRYNTIRYWFIATGSYMNICGNISTVYSPAHLGLLKPYSNSERFTYPLAIGACLAAQQGAQRWSISGNGVHQGFWCADSQYGQLGVRLMMNDGVIRLFTGTSEYGNTIHPGRHMFNLNRNFDSSIPMFPVILYSYFNGDLVNTFCPGQLQGMQQVSGDNALSENRIQTGKVTYIVFQGVYETTKTTYVAYELV